MAKEKFYISTAIDYVNSRPHVGHSFEKVLADAIARWQRLNGKDVFFLTGVDENAQKNVQAAEKAGMPTKKFIDKNAGYFLELCKKLNISQDEFVRTTAKEHEKVVQKIVKKIIDKGDIYKTKYEGLYCTGCEQYYSENELVNGKCPEHDKVPELRKEDAYFFKLSKYKKELQKLIPKYVLPESRMHEVLNRVNEEVNDVCISRYKASWGIDFPNDKDFKIWVWIDALINYISGLKDKEKNYWPAQLHVVGKGINWFHSVIWPAMLLSAEYKLPEKLLVHGYLTTEGKKMSKSLGNVIDPLELLNKYQTDTIRYSLLRCSVFDDSDYSEELIIERHNTELANKLGNLVSRVSTLAEKYGIEKTKEKLSKENLEEIKQFKENPKEHGEILSALKINDDEIQGGKKTIARIKSEEGQEFDFIHQNTLKEVLALRKRFPKTQHLVESHLNNYELDKAINEVFGFIDICNTYVQVNKPWETKDTKVLYELCLAIKNIAILISPFIPETAEKIAKTFNFKISLDELNKPLKEGKIKKSEILFQKIQ